jgi:hypothetical protein
MIACVSGAGPTTQHALTLARPEPGSKETVDSLVLFIAWPRGVYCMRAAGWEGQPGNQTCGCLHPESLVQAGQATKNAPLYTEEGMGYKAGSL